MASLGRGTSQLSGTGWLSSMTRVEHVSKALDTAGDTPWGATQTDRRALGYGSGLLADTNILMRLDTTSIWRPRSDSGAQIPPALAKYV